MPILRPGITRHASLLLVLFLGLSLISTALTSEVANAADQSLAEPDRVMLANFPIYAQQHSLSCEYASSRMQTAYWGQEIGEAEYIKMIPVHTNPHIGYLGNIDGPFGGTRDYGIYAEPMVKILEAKGFKTKLLVGGAEALKQELRLGRPVQVWIIAGMGYGSPFTTSYEGLSFKLAAREHSVVIYGYDSLGVFVADPAYGRRYQTSWDTFLRNWGYFDDMALSIWPANQSSPTEEGLSWNGVSPLFYRYWLNTNGLKLFGLPIGPAKTEGSKVTQYFERARLEWDLNSPYNQPVVLELLGQKLTLGRQKEKPFQPIGGSFNNAEVLFFQNTGHTLTNRFRSFWEQEGGLAIFGYPISEEFVENGRTVQYFERSRLEYHAEEAENFKVMLGRVGVEFLKVT